MRLLNPRGLDLPHAGLRSCVGPKRTAIIEAAICKADKVGVRRAKDAKRNRRNRLKAIRDKAIKARAAAKAKAPAKPVFDAAPPAPNEPRRSMYVGPGSKWHRRMVESGRKG